MSGNRFSDLGRIQRGDDPAPSEPTQVRPAPESRVIMQARVPVSVRRAVRAQLLAEEDALGYQPTQEGIITALLQEWLEDESLRARVRERLG